MGVLIWLFVWLLPMIISGMLAQQQGRSVFLWVALSFFFGWIPTIILLIMAATIRS